jgi:hypothetical protein
MNNPMAYVDHSGLCTVDADGNFQEDGDSSDPCPGQPVFTVTGTADPDPGVGALPGGICGYLPMLCSGFGFAPATVYAVAPPTPPASKGPDEEKRGLFGCASEAASKVSIAGALQRFGIGTSGAGKFVTEALGGNAFSGATDLVHSLATGDNIAYSLGQGLAAGPAQGFGAVFGKSIKNTPWTSGPVDAATDAIVTKFMSVATGTGNLQTLSDTVELGSVLGEAAEWATGFGEIKLGYDALTYFGGLVGCATGAIH